jgi:TPR repeat protein
MYNLGAGYFNNTGVNDAGEAVRWLRKAASLGVAEAKATLMQLGDQ